MNDIDNKNAKYINVAIEKIRIIMNNNKDIEGNLLRILKNYQLFDTGDLNFTFSNIKSLNNNSLFTPKKIHKTNSVEIIKEDIVINDDEISKSIRNSMKFSLKNIQSYIENKLQNTTELTIKDFVLDDKDEFINSRGFSFDDVDKMCPGNKIKTSKDFIEFIMEISEGIDSYAKERRKVLDLYHTYQDDKSTKRLVDYFEL